MFRGNPTTFHNYQLVTQLQRVNQDAFQREVQQPFQHALMHQHHRQEDEEEEEQEVIEEEEDDTEERIEAISVGIKTRMKQLDQQAKILDEQEKKLATVLYLAEHGEPPPKRRAVASSLNGTSVGAALLALLDAPNNPLDNDALVLGELKCPFQVDPREGFSRWSLSLKFADTLWLPSERRTVIEAARNPSPQLRERVKEITNDLDNWIARGTSCIEKKIFQKRKRKAFIPGVGKILGRKDSGVRELIASKPPDFDETSDTTPMRDWIKSREEELVQEAEDAQEKAREEAGKLKRPIN